MHQADNTTISALALKKVSAIVSSFNMCQGWREHRQRYVVQCRHGEGAVALGDYVAGAVFAATALGGNAQLKLDFIKTHARTRMAGNVTVRNTAADTNNLAVGR